jgi:hypothetical protein
MAQGTASLETGTSVRFVGVAMLGVEFGEAGTVADVAPRIGGQQRYRVEFGRTDGPLSVWLWPAEVERVVEVVATLEFEDGRVAALLSDGSWEHYLYLSMADREDMMAVADEFASRRFTAVTHDGVPTVRDNRTGRVLRHQGKWDEAFAAVVAQDLELNPGPAHLLTWEAA